MFDSPLSPSLSPRLPPYIADLLACGRSSSDSSSWYMAHYEWVLNCVATLRSSGGPGLTTVLGPYVGSMGTKHGGLAYAMNSHGQNWTPPKAALGNVPYWPAIVFSGGCVLRPPDCRGDWLLLAADVTGGCGVCSLKISEFLDSGLSILLSSVPFGLL